MTYDLFDQPQPDDEHPHIPDGYEEPLLVHGDGHDTEYQAAAKATPAVGKWRTAVFKFAVRRGLHGITGWEACEHFDMAEHQSTVRTAITDLSSERCRCIMTRTKERRENANGNEEGVYVATIALRRHGKG